jgi:hypothetical protein
MLLNCVADERATRKLVDWARWSAAEVYGDLPAELVDEDAAADTPFPPLGHFPPACCEVPHAGPDRQRHVQCPPVGTASGSSGHRRVSRWAVSTCFYSLRHGISEAQTAGH